ncbi:YrhB domain-containing protein [Kitasatospora sp. NPDC127111]|uniref:YrhB domain-containing protein n=1 Tax=Kitasatospora sp. NPDC127111 TaxID=3345363 RepID=UPI00362F871D
MISKERAVELAESLLAREQMTWPWSPVPELAIHSVEEYSVGWVFYWDTAEFARTGDARLGFGSSSHYLVDRHDGSIHFVPAVRGLDEGWEDDYLWQTRGVRPPDPLAAAVRELVRSAGVVAAMSHLRKEAPRLSLQQAKAYVAVVRDGAEPPEDLAALTRKAPKWPFQPVETLAGPVQ